MREFAIVKDIRRNEKTEKEEIFVLPMIVGACQSCKTGCLKQGKPFKVLNKRGFALKEGMTVKIGHPKILMAFHGLLSVLGPIAAAVAGFVFAPEISARFFGQAFTEQNSEAARAGITAAALVVSSMVLFVVSRSSIHLKTPEVLQIV